MIHNGWYGYYSNYLPISTLRIEYIAAAVWWLIFSLSSLIGIVYLSSTGRDIMGGGRLKRARLVILEYGAPLIWIIVVYILIKTLTSPMYFLSLLMALASGSSWIYWNMLNGIVRLFLPYGLLYIITIYYIRHLYKQRRLASTLGILIIVLNVVLFSHSIYPRIPKCIGGGKLDHVSIVFEKGCMPADLEWIRNNPYNAFIINDDTASIYLYVYKPYWIWYHSKPMPWSGRTYIIKRDNISSIIVHR